MDKRAVLVNCSAQWHIHQLFTRFIISWTISQCDNLNSNLLQAAAGLQIGCWMHNHFITTINMDCHQAARGRINRASVPREADPADHSGLIRSSGLAGDSSAWMVWRSRQACWTRSTMTPNCSEFCGQRMSKVFR